MRKYQSHEASMIIAFKVFLRGSKNIEKIEVVFYQTKADKLISPLLLVLLYKNMTDEVEPHILENFQLVKKIGSGAYGHVWKVVDRQTKTVKALKKNFDAFSNSTDAQRTYREIMFLRQLKHSNIINLEKTIRARNDKDIYLLFEHMDVDLHTLIREDGKSTNLQEKHKQYIIYQIAKAIYYLHNSNLIHRDLKPSNILINESCDAKLCDFGLVRFIQEPEDRELVVMTDYIATRWYRAPQLLLGCKDYNKEVDIWAFGSLIGQMFYGKALFPGTSTINQIEKVVAWTGAPTHAELKSMSINLNQTLLQLLNTRKKINRAEFFGNKISSGCLDLISKMLEFDPSKRITIEEVLKHQYLSQFYDEKEFKQIKQARVKIQLHINDNRKLTVKDYRQLIYSEINSKKVLSNSYTPNTSCSHPTHSASNHSKTKSIKNDENRNSKKLHMLKEKSRQKTIALESGQTYGWNKSQQTVYHSTDVRQDSRDHRKEVKSSLDKSVKSKVEVKKKGISLCSKTSSKNTSLSKKKVIDMDTVQSRQLISEQIKKLKPVSRSCSEKYEKARKIIAQESCYTKNYRKVLLTEFYVNQNIGRKVMQMH